MTGYAGSVTFAALRERFALDRSPTRGGSLGRFSRALRKIGWGGTDLMSADDVAGYLVDIVDACVSGHHDLMTLYRDIAELLRHAGPLLDGSLPPTEAYLPAAEDIVRHYVLDVE